MSEPAPRDRFATAGADDPLVTGEAVALDVRPASALIRGGGTAIDVLLSVALLAGVALALLNLSLDEAAVRAVAITSLVVVLVVVPTAIETATRGRSLGKLALGLRVVRDDGGATGFRHAFVRALTGVLEIYLTFGGLAVLVGFLTPSSKRLGDVLAGTHAQVERAPRVVTQTFGVPTALASWAVVADVGRLPDPLERRVASFFRTAGHLVPASRARVAESLAAEVAPYVEPVPQVPAELFLAGVVALRRERDLTALRLERERLEALAPVLDARPVGFPVRSDA
ncbi:RDD family protein [Agromyces sp. G08B096]|uniref:RDD family protein n=1 Tax=Agromyces sp. G08B096 TaxID=3156399 RepID=A0AAU7W5K3_9MICO